MGFKFVEFKSAGLYENHAEVTWNLRTISAFDYKNKETQENPCRDGRSQDLPDRYRLVAKNPATKNIEVP
jgi:hypothetical protein